MFQQESRNRSCQILRQVLLELYEAHSARFARLLSRPGSLEHCIALLHSCCQHLAGAGRRTPREPTKRLSRPETSDGGPALRQDLSKLYAPRAISPRTVKAQKDLSTENRPGTKGERELRKNPQQDAARKVLQGPQFLPGPTSPLAPPQRPPGDSILSRR